ncbi:ABC-type transporter, integral membrane subunit [Spirochaeta thermophila DSM 6578]|uniref:ABC-type transporter, integral membrane subunit n=1 Tax=Winmispira thermophila (strain ATCC 700085 / DSM 6578 / Z-1203) TaxID=869211 RepID=G0GA27_WINT7|nr:carbohydrate ABC transporter permease [Spirochaeta thermophila]AEJ61715.1 ABC-type transporter, integral membrane subunit [Spirochaeta thermophila DSM 6578]
MRTEYALRQKAAAKILLYLVLVVGAVFFLVPVYVLLATSLKSFAEVNIQNMWSLPRTVSLEGFAKALEKLGPNFLNSVLLTVPATILSAFLGSINGYIFAKWRFPGANLLFAFVLFGMFIPYQSILIPLVQFLSRIRLYGTLPGLILTHVVYGIPITTLIFRNYYTEIPGSLIEAAQIDGLGLFRIYRHILLPLSAPAFVVVVIWQMTSIWNEFLFAVTITQNPRVQPITVALQNLAGSQIVEWNVQMAGALLAALPPLLVYLLLGKYFIRGLLAGSVKQ